MCPICWPHRGIFFAPRQAVPPLRDRVRPQGEWPAARKANPYYFSDRRMLAGESIMSGIVCPSCGDNNSASSWKYCHKCGGRLDAKVVPTNRPGTPSARAYFGYARLRTRPSRPTRSSTLAFGPCSGSCADSGWQERSSTPSLPKRFTCRPTERPASPAARSSEAPFSNLSATGGSRRRRRGRDESHFLPGGSFSGLAPLSAGCLSDLDCSSAAGF